MQTTIDVAGAMHGVLAGYCRAAMAIALLLLGSTAWAGAVDRVMADINQLESLPSQIDHIYDAIEKAKLYSRNDAKAIDQRLDKYANGMRRTYTAVLKLSQSEAKSEGKANSGATRALEALEKMAQTHEKRLANLEARGRKLEDAIKNGEVWLDADTLKAMGKSEREDFLKYVSNPTSNSYREKYKDLFAAAFTRFADLITPEAEASTLAGCIPFCTPAAASGAWPVCLSCVVAAGASAIYRWNTFRSALAACDKLRWSWMRTPCKTAAVSAYVAYIA